MIFAKCHQCRHAWFIQGEQLELDQLLSLPEWKQSFPCPTPLCVGRAMRSGGLKEATSQSGVVPIPVQDFYRGIMGLGNGAPADLVRKLLLESKIVAMDATSKSGRTVIKSLTFADGTKMHFGVSQLGACIYNIEEVGSEIRTNTAAEGGDSDREEIGRDVEVDVGRVADEFRARRSAASASTIEQSRTGAMPDVPTAGGVPASESTPADESDSNHPPVRV